MATLLGGRVISFRNSSDESQRHSDICKILWHQRETRTWGATHDHSFSLYPGFLETLMVSIQWTMKSRMVLCYSYRRVKYTAHGHKDVSLTLFQAS